jgi:hypothetical protein
MTPNEYLELNSFLTKIHRPDCVNPAIGNYTENVVLCFQLMEFLNIDEVTFYPLLAQKAVFIDGTDAYAYANTYVEAFALCLKKYIDLENKYYETTTF